jgi:hypothetical protein
MLDRIRATLWHYGEAMELNGYDAQALWLYAWSFWFPW